MNIIPKDIIRQDVNTIWVSERYLCGILGNNFSDYLRCVARPNYRKHIHPRYWSDTFLPPVNYGWRYGRINGMFYYDYDHIPNRSNSFYRSKIGNRPTLLETSSSFENIFNEVKMLLQKEAIDYKYNYNIQYYLAIKVNGEYLYDLNKAEQLSEALGWLRMIRAKVDNGDFIEYGVISKTDFHQICASILKEKELYGFKITTAGSLRKKLFYFPTDTISQLGYLVSARFGNKNAQKSKS